MRWWGSLTKRQHGNTTWTTTTVARKLEKSCGQSPWIRDTKRRRNNTNTEKDRVKTHRVAEVQLTLTAPETEPTWAKSQVCTLSHGALHNRCWEQPNAYLKDNAFRKKDRLKTHRVVVFLRYRSYSETTKPTPLAAPQSVRLELVKLSLGFAFHAFAPFAALHAFGVDE